MSQKVILISKSAERLVDAANNATKLGYAPLSIHTDVKITTAGAHPEYNLDPIGNSFDKK